MKQRTIILIGLVGLSSCSPTKILQGDWPVALGGNGYSSKGGIETHFPTLSPNATRTMPKGRPVGRYEQERVRYNEKVSTYHIGRTVNKDRSEMSEAHKVYKIAQNGRWDKRLRATPKGTLGEIVGVDDVHSRSVHTSSLIQAERRRQQDLSSKLRDSYNRIFEIRQNMELKSASLQGSEPIIKDLKEALTNKHLEASALKFEVEKSNKKIESLEGELEVLNSEMNEGGEENE